MPRICERSSNVLARLTKRVRGTLHLTLHWFSRVTSRRLRRSAAQRL